MSCNGTLFSFRELDEVSVENEAWISTHCISNRSSSIKRLNPNRIKFNLLHFYILVYCLLVLTFMGLTFYGFHKKKLKKKLKKKGPSLKEHLTHLCLLGCTTKLKQFEENLFSDIHSKFGFF